jgi:7-cyano-7-deazaguanine reductase
MELTRSLLGKNTQYHDKYNPDVLFAIPRLAKRQEIGLDKSELPFFGVDIWNAYEISWLNQKGKPLVAIGELIIPCESEFIVESKSLKLYLNSLNNMNYDSLDEVKELIEKDISKLLRERIKVKVSSLEESTLELSSIGGLNIDHLDVTCSKYDDVNRNILEFSNEYTEEEISSNLLKSNCLVTGQPDWGSILIKYRGKKLDHASVLKYLISFRNHNEFHEQCVERIFCDIQNTINPKYLSVYARYTRRGGIDICPYRSTISNELLENKRLVRQ